MNYKVMNRPMFRMGGSTAPRENFNSGTFPSTSSDFLTSAMEKYRKQQESAKNMGNLNMFKTLARSSKFLPQDTNNPFEYVSNILSNPGFLGEVILPGMTDKKKEELALNDPKTDLAFAKALQPSSSAFSTRMKSQAAIKAIQEDINILNSQLGTADTPGKKDMLRQKIRDLNEQKRAYISGDTLRMKAYAIYLDTEKGKEGVPPTEEELQEIENNLQGFMGGNAMGGLPNRVDRQMGSPMMGEESIQQPIQPGSAADPMVEAGVQQEEQDPYVYLRQRLPAEVPDQVVKLIAFNKEAFDDFASIETQDDVDKFNQRYNVELVINV